MTNYDQTILDLAKEVAAKLYKYSSAEIENIADWLLHEGGDNGGSVSALAQRYKSTH